MDIKQTLNRHKFSLTSKSIKKYFKKITPYPIERDLQIDLLKKIISFIDLTTLEGTDTREKIKNLCLKAINPLPENKSIPSCAAVCIYPVFIKYAKNILKNSKVILATVGTSFPSGQYQQSVKFYDVKRSIKDGAEEIDMVISRGEFLTGNYQYVFDEIREVKNICSKYSSKLIKVRLKVILEVGELGSLENIWNASIISMYAGADFIKTSTGKISASVTPESATVMLQSIKDFYKKAGKKIGFKASGGIRTAEDAIKYFSIVKSILGEKWLNKEYFRIGASSLLDNIITLLRNLKVE